MRALSGRAMLSGSEAARSRWKFCRRSRRAATAKKFSKSCNKSSKAVPTRLRRRQSGNLMFKNIALVGCGLIGSSLLHAVRGKFPDIKISVLEKTDVVARVKALGKADVVSDDPAIVADADLIVFCVPVGAYEATAQAISSHLKPGAVVSDVGSVKESALKALQENLSSDIVLIGGHPIAGTEHSGPEAGFAELFA